MTNVTKILNEARKYIGVTQYSSQHRAMVDTYNTTKPLPVGYAVSYDDDWCDVFISFLAIRTNATSLIGRECGVQRHVDLFKGLGIWIEDGNITPKPGDIIVFAWSKNTQPNNAWSDHIGIVEKVEGKTITTIEGNSDSAVKRRTYKVGHGNIRGYARPKYAGKVVSATPSNTQHYNHGSLRNAGREFSQENIQKIMKYAQKYRLLPSFLIAQMYIESHWGDPNTSIVGSKNNNWSGISQPFNAPSDLGIRMRRGSARPNSEGGYYVHFETLDDYFKAYTFILSNRNGLYRVEGATTIESFCQGLFRSGGANADYAASGYKHYYDLLVPTYNAIKRQNPGKLEMIDGLVSLENSSSYSVPSSATPSSPPASFTRVAETGVFYPNRMLNVRDHPSTAGKIVAQYESGENLTYDSYVVNEGYVWLSYVSHSGARRYIAWRVHKGEVFGKIV